MPPKDKSESWIPRELADLRRQIRELQASIPKAFNGSISKGGLTVDGGGSINVSGGGKVTVNGLTLSAVSAASAWNNSSGTFGVSTTPETVASCSVPVPEGFTQAVVTASANGWAACDQTAGDYLYVQAVCTASSTNEQHLEKSPAIPAQGSSGTYYGFSPYPQGWVLFTQTYAGLNGGTLGTGCQIFSDSHTWAANSFTGGTVQMSVIFLP